MSFIGSCPVDSVAMDPSLYKIGLHCLPCRLSFISNQIMAMIQINFSKSKIKTFFNRSSIYRLEGGSRGGSGSHFTFFWWGWPVVGNIQVGKLDSHLLGKVQGNMDQGRRSLHLRICMAVDDLLQVQVQPLCTLLVEVGGSRLRCITGVECSHLLHISEEVLQQQRQPELRLDRPSSCFT